jgi:protein ImuB
MVGTIEQEWWIKGRHRDYYSVEDEEGKRYWLFNQGTDESKHTNGSCMVFT